MYMSFEPRAGTPSYEKKMRKLYEKHLKPICADCEKPCDVYMDDIGIGSYEYGDGHYYDSQPVKRSKCCDGYVWPNVY